MGIAAYTYPGNGWWLGWARFGPGKPEPISGISVWIPFRKGRLWHFHWLWRY